MTAWIAQLDVYRSAIPMRSFAHAAATRNVAEAVLVRVELADGRAGWGETLPRQYVTGETIESVAGDIEKVIWPAVTEEGNDRGRGGGRGRPGTGGEETDHDHESRSREEGNPNLLSPIPGKAADGRCIHAAACAVELAIIDVMAQGGGAGGVAAVLGRTAQPGIDACVSGVLGSADPRKTARRLRLMRLYGMRDFKLKLGFGEDVDAENLRVVGRQIGRALAAGRCTLRVDVNGGWSAEETPRRVAAVKLLGVCAVEQPAFCGAAELAELAKRCVLPLMADESLLTMDDARALLAGAGDRVWWNIRISKNGGLRAALELAELAAAKGVPWTAGCMVGESAILSAAQRRLLEVAPRPRFVEGNYGRLLLADDLARPSLRLGYGGRLGVLGGSGLGVRVRAEKIEKYAERVLMLRA
jgi:muconate cycloisomerase